MADRHPDRQTLERFMLADLPTAEMRSVLRHLFAGCDSCPEVTAELWDVGIDGEEEGPVEARGPYADSEYDRVLDRVFARVEAVEVLLARERAQARELFEELARHPAARQHLLVNNSGRFRVWSLCELLLEKSLEAVFQEPARAIELAELAVMVGTGLDAGSRGEGALQNLRARAWAYLGNARRVASDFRGADQAFRLACSLVTSDGGAGLLDKARILDLLASLRAKQARTKEALQLLDRTLVIYRRLGQKHLVGRTLAQKAIVHGEAGEYEPAIVLLRQALELLDPQEEPRMLLAARHNLIYYLTEVGAYKEAFALLFHTRPLYLQTGERTILTRLRVVEGTIAAGLGRFEQAETAFRETREAFLELGMELDAALVSLELAAVYAAQRRSADMRRLCEEMLPIFQSRSIHREAMAALSVFKQAVDLERAEVGLIWEVRHFLRRSERNPDLRFTPRS